MENMVAQYGVFAVYLLCALEGDAAAISGAVLAENGLLRPAAVFVAIAAGGYTTDTVVYLLARQFRDHRRVLKALSHPMAEKISHRFLSRPVLLAAIFRFIPGARTITPVLLATATPLRPWVYFTVTGCAAILWAGAMMALGYGASAAISRMLGRVTPTEIALAIPIIAGLLLAARFGWRWVRSG